MNKKIIVFLALLMGVSFVRAGSLDEIFQSNRGSFTMTNETARLIPNTPPGTIFVGVVVGSAMPQGSGILIYDSSGQASNQVGFVTGYSVGSAQFQANYNIRLSSGLTYTTIGNSSGFTILYKKTTP